MDRQTRDALTHIGREVVDALSGDPAHVAAHAQVWLAALGDATLRGQWLRAVLDAIPDDTQRKLAQDYAGVLCVADDVDQRTTAMRRLLMLVPDETHLLGIIATLAIAVDAALQVEDRNDLAHALAIRAAHVVEGGTA